MKTIGFLLIVLSILGTAGTALADNTWNQLFQQTSTETYLGKPVGTFDEIDIFWKSGDQFSAQAFTGFTVKGWANTNISPTEAYGKGPANQRLALPPGTLIFHCNTKKFPEPVYGNKTDI